MGDIMYEISISNVLHTMKKHIPVIASLFVTSALVVPVPSLAAEVPFEVSGWIPYWRSDEGVESILPHVEKFSEVNPFLYTVRTDGTLYQASPLTADEWVTLRAAAAGHDVLFIPTVMWSNPDAMDEIFRDEAKRRAHVRSIANEVYTNDLDGIDIDYEAKYARTKDYFSLFLRDLNEAIGYDKQIMCTVESRTPLDSRYSSPESIPDDIAYANDFTAINRYCDRVRIMAYDQMRIDLKLNEERGHPYIPVADVAWVEKVMRLIAQEVDPSKLVIGVPTYGYEYDMIPRDGWTQYSRLWSFNPGYAVDQAAAAGVEPTRNAAGELSLVYPASLSLDPIRPLPDATRVMWWSDAESIRQKAELAKELGLRGIAIFKIDGGQDPALWDMLAQYENTTVAVDSQTAAPAGNNTAIVVPNRDLQYGDRHEDVRTLQRFLNQQGFTVAQSGGGSPGNETLFFGPATRAAVARFQAAHNVAPAAGYYGPLTRAAIASL